MDATTARSLDSRLAIAATKNENPPQALWHDIADHITGLQVPGIDTVHTDGQSIGLQLTDGRYGRVGVLLINCAAQPVVSVDGTLAWEYIPMLQITNEAFGSTAAGPLDVRCEIGDLDILLPAVVAAQRR